MTTTELLNRLKVAITDTDHYPDKKQLEALFACIDGLTERNERIFADVLQESQVKTSKRSNKSDAKSLHGSSDE